MNKKIFNSIIVGIIIIGGLAGFYIWKGLTARPSFSNITVKKGNIQETINLLGTIKPQDKIDLGFEIGGKIEKIYHKSGDKVSQNDVLAVLSDADLSAQYNQAVSLAQSAEGLLKNYKQLTDKEKYKLKALKSADAATNDKKSQQEQVDAQKALVSSQENQVKAAWDNVLAKRAQLAKATIRAQFSGTVAKVNFDEGEIATSGTPVLTLINEKAFEIEVFSSELDFENIKIEQSGEAKILENQSKTYQVKVSKIDQTETSTNGISSYKITLEILNSDKSLHSGMAASVDLGTVKKDNVVVVPKDSIFQDAGVKYIYVIANGNQEKRKVETGILGNDGMVEIISGLNEGENILILNNK